MDEWICLDICKTTTTTTVTIKFEMYTEHLCFSTQTTKPLNHHVENEERQMQEEVNDCTTICCRQVDYNLNKFNISVFAC